MPGLVIGSEEGWGVVAVSGTGSNCRGWDRERKREGRVTGHGVLMGEGAGGSELMHRCMQLVGYAWTKRGPMTKLAEALAAHAGAKYPRLVRVLKSQLVGARHRPIPYALDSHQSPSRV